MLDGLGDRDNARVHSSLFIGPPEHTRMAS